MAAIAKWIPAGIAKGILDNLKYVKDASKRMSSAVTLDFTKPLSKASGSYRQMLKLATATAKENQKLVKETTTVNGKTITTYLNKTSKERYEAFESTLSDHKNFNDVSLQQEKAYWENAAKHLKAGSAAQRKALQNVANLKQSINQQQYSNEIDYIDKAAKYNVLSLRDQIRAMQTYMKQYKVGSAEQVAYEERLYDTKLDIYNSISQISESYLRDIQSVYDGLIDEEKRLREAWQDTFDARKATLANTWGLFDEVKLTEMVTYGDDGSIESQIDLLKNMRSQVSALSNWMHDLSRLETSGIADGLLKELQEMGPKAAAEIHALANMTQNELKEYQQLWQKKSELAGTQATKELADSRLDMEKEIAQLKTNAGKEIEAMKNKMLEEINLMVNGSTDQFNVLKMTLPQIGKDAMQGLIDGMKGMKGALGTVLSDIANSTSNSLKNIMNGVQFNVDAVQPVVNAGTFKVNSSVVNDQSFVQQPINIMINQEWDGEDVIYTVGRERAETTRLSVFKRQ